MKEASTNKYLESLILLHYGSPEESSFLYKKVRLKSPTKIIYLQTEKEEQIYVPPLDYDYFKRYSKIKNVKLFDSLPNFKGNIIESLAILFKKYKGKRKIVVPAVFPCRILEKLRKNGITIELKDSYFIRYITIKDKSEIRYIERTARVIKGCFGYIREILDEANIKNGHICYKGKKLDTDKLLLYINDFLIKYNIICDISTIASGKNSFFPHYQRNHYLKEGVPIIIDLACKNLSNGYYVDVSRTYCKGVPKHSFFLVLYKHLFSIKKKLEEDIKVGNIISDFAVTAENMFSDIKTSLGSSNFRNGTICHHSLGHGIGREIHQLPVLNKNAKVPFEKNMIIAFEPGAYIKGQGGIRIEDTYLIAEEGTKNLTSGNYKFLIH